MLSLTEHLPQNNSSWTVSKSVRNQINAVGSNRLKNALKFRGSDQVNLHRHRLELTFRLFSNFQLNEFTEDEGEEEREAKVERSNDLVSSQVICLSWIIFWSDRGSQKMKSFILFVSSLVTFASLEVSSVNTHLGRKSTVVAGRLVKFTCDPKRCDT